MNDANATNATNATEQLPVFVYGTLRSGEINYRLFLEGKTTREEPAVLLDHALHTDLYPYVFDSEDGSHVQGELMFLPADEYDDLLARLDKLEGYSEGDPSSLYLRVKRRVRLADAEGGTATSEAWVYHAGPEVRSMATDENRIHSGDWLAHRR